MGGLQILSGGDDVRLRLISLHCMSVSGSMRRAGKKHKRVGRSGAGNKANAELQLSSDICTL